MFGGVLGVFEGHSTVFFPLSSVRAMADAPSVSALEDPRAQWAREMRLLFSPTGSRDARGDIVQDHFKPTRIQLRVEERSASRADDDRCRSQSVEPAGPTEEA